MLLVGMFYGLYGFAGIIQRFTVAYPIEKRLLYSALGLGVIYGAALSVTAAQVAVIIYKWIEARQGFRTELLMMKYHDALKEKETSNQGMHAPSLNAPPHDA